MGKAIDMTGNKYGRLTALELVGVNEHKQRLWKFACDCGKEVVIVGSEARCGHTKSCGCLNHESLMARNHKHGMTRSPEWNVWIDMMARCYKPYKTFYKHYGGRGIKVCDRWHDFQHFYADMGERPEGKTLDRINNDGDYSPENCRWATNKEQGNNRRDNRLITHDGITKTLTQWADSAGITAQLLYQRLRRGVGMDMALRASMRAAT